MKRSGKFYRKNEAEVMKSLGLTPTPNSGSGWLVKEDGQSDDVICQLKSTDASSIRIAKIDIDTLIYNASVSHKIPVFAIQFIQTNEVYLLVQPSDLQDLGKLLNGETIEKSTTEFLGISQKGFESQGDPEDKVPRRMIRSGSTAREEFRQEHENKFKKARKSAT